MTQTKVDQTDAIVNKILTMEPGTQTLVLRYLDLLLRLQKRQEEQTP